MMKRNDNKFRMFNLTDPEKTLTRFRLSRPKRRKKVSSLVSSRKSSVPVLKVEKSHKILARKPSMDFERRLQELETVDNFVSKKVMKLKAQDVRLLLMV